MPLRTNEPTLEQMNVGYDATAAYYDPQVDQYYDDRRNVVTIDANTLAFSAPFTRTNYVTREEMADFAKKIYEVMLTYTKIDITEEEFMKLIKE